MAMPEYSLSAIETMLRDLPRAEFRARLRTELQRKARSFMPEGFRTVTPYIVVDDAPGLIEFAARAFDAQEIERSTGSGGGVQAHVRIGDSMLMIGGGAPPDRPFSGQPWTTAFHLYVKDTDAVYEQALRAGATSIGEPRDMEYGERSGGVKDTFGNTWYIATAHGERHIPAGLQTVNVYLHPLRAEPLIDFMTRAFGATDIEKHASPDGIIHHANVRIGDTVIEMGEAHGPYQPIPTRFYVYVADVDGAFRRALDAGAASISEPADQPYGDRLAGVKDPFGNQWFLASRLRAIG
jgi:uncharacterized glyoxalase superfamily protein PhnB